MRLRPVLLAALALAVATTGILTLRAVPARKPLAPSPGAFMKGMIYVGLAADVFASRLSDRVLGELAQTGANWVAVTPVWFQESYDATEVRPLSGFTPTDDSLRHVIRLAHRLGLRVLLRPVVEAEDGSWRGAFHPSDWDTWFSSYRRMIEHYAGLAAAEGVEAFQVGSGYSSSDAGRPDDWRRVIAAARGRFRGPVLYGADWYQYQKIPFWDALDFVGINAFFPLTDEERPDLAELEEGWRRRAGEIARWRQRAGLAGKKVVFTEIGYPSRVGAAARPNAPSAFAPLDLDAQRDAYEATFRTVYREPWLAGLFWYWWDNPSVADWPGGRRNPGFTPRGKPAGQVLARWYRQPRA